jgi:hypothetical protein
MVCTAVPPVEATSSSISVRVLDPSQTEGIPGAVVLLNPGDVHKSRAFVTDRSGNVSIPDVDCKFCIVTAMDPRQLFQNATTQFQGGAASVTLVLPVRPIIDTLWQPGSIKLAVRVADRDGSRLPNQAVLVRKEVETIENHSFSVLTTDSRGLITIELPPGEYVLASLVHGEFLEAPLSLDPEVRDKCSKVEARCFLDAAGRREVRNLRVNLVPPRH